MQSADPHASGGHGGNMFDAFNQLLPSQPPTSEPSSSSPFSSGLSQAGSVSNQNSAGGDGDRFSALESELQAFNQQPAPTVAYTDVWGKNAYGTVSFVSLLTLT